MMHHTFAYQWLSALQYPSLSVNGVGGVFLSWWDHRNGNWDIYAQNVNSAGAVLWAANGLPLCTAPGDQDLPEMVPDDVGGAIVTWRDKRTAGSFGVYAQRVNGSGVTRWTPNGATVCTVNVPGLVLTQEFNPMIVKDTQGGAIIAWFDSRAGGSDIYAQRIQGSGALGGEAPVPTLASLSSATRTEGRVEITWFVPGIGLGMPEIEKRTDTTEWRLLGWPGQDGSGFVRYTDTDIENAVRYGYRLRFTDPQGGRVYAAETWVEPTLIGVALHSLTANPSPDGRIALALSLPGAMHADVQLLDIAGRVLESRHIDAGSAATHTIAFGGERRMAPGIYLVRAATTSGTLLQRIVMLD